MTVRAIVVEISPCAFFKGSALLEVPLGGLRRGLRQGSALQISGLCPPHQLIGNAISIHIVFVQVAGLGADGKHYARILVALLALVGVGNEIGECMLLYGILRAAIGDRVR